MAIKRTHNAEGESDVIERTIRSPETTSNMHKARKAGLRPKLLENLAIALDVMKSATLKTCIQLGDRVATWDDALTSKTSTQRKYGNKRCEIGFW